jgi:2-polyprenyl-3-methyl-5-hydroxy-6-metoxy-1,4-benzoquinol methylase
MGKESQEFNKYKEKGAYHWKETRKYLKRYNAGLTARYTLSRRIIASGCGTPGTIADIGCGDGFFTSILAGSYRGAKVRGFDTDSTAIELAAKNTGEISNLSFTQGDAFEHLETADLITALDVIEHMYKPYDFMESCFRTLSQGGHLFLSTPVRIKEIPDDPYHMHEYFYEELEKFSGVAGFSIVEHRVSHDYIFLERYNRRIRLMGAGKMRLYKYLYNLMAIYFDNNVFERSDCTLPAMQYILLKKD